MILLLAMFAAFGGAVVALAIALGWHGAALVLGFAPPSPDQVAGLAELFAAFGGLGLPVLAGVVFMVEELRA